MKIAFAGFGEVNTPKEVLIRKCKAAAESLPADDLVTTVYPITDDYEEKDIKAAVAALKEKEFDVLVVCIAGWIPTHAVVKVTENFKHIPMVLWGLCGWTEGDRTVTTADQAGTTALRKTFADLGYKFTYIYDIIGKPSNVQKVLDFCAAAEAAKQLRSAKAGMGGYRDMNLYGTLYDGASLKRVVGPEIETFELLEVEQRYRKINDAAKQRVIVEKMDWKFLRPAQTESKMKAAGYYLAIKSIIDERGYTAVSLKDVDGMKKLCGFPPAPIFMLLSDNEHVCTVPENDSLGCVTQMMVHFITGQVGAYLEFYEFFEDRVLAGVPDFVPAEVVDGEVTVMPAAFGELSEGILNVSKVRTGDVTMFRLGSVGDRYVMHIVKGKGVTPRKWEECGWAQPAPQLPGLEIIMPDVEDFAEKVMCQHYIIAYGDPDQNERRMKYLCKILGIEVI